MYTEKEVSTMNNNWSEWFAPYYENWIDESIGEKAGIFVKSVGIQQFMGGRDATSLPNPASNPNEWDWSWFNDVIANCTAVAQGRATFNWRIDLEGSGNYPTVLENNGYTQIVIQNNNEVMIWNWSNQNAINFLKDFYTAYAAQFNDNEYIWSYSISEQNGSPTNTKDDFVLHCANTVTKQYFYVFQNTSVWSNSQIRGDPRIGFARADQKPFEGTCGNGPSAFPNNSCGLNGHWGVAQSDNCVLQNPPGPGFRGVLVGTESNGFSINTRDGDVAAPRDLPNPFGVPLPHPDWSFPATNMDCNVAAWYASYTPRAQSPADDSRLGQQGRDPNGVIPATNLALSLRGQRQEGIRPADWNRAMLAFGASGTKALFWPPFGFDDQGGGGNPRPFISAVGDGTLADGETNIVISGSNFGSSQGNGWVRVYETSSQGGVSQNQAIDSWSASSIQFDFTQGGVASGTAYVFVQTNAGDTSSGFAFTIQGTSGDPVIQSVIPTTIYPGLQNISIRGTDFGGTQNEVTLNEQSNGAGVEMIQPVTFWSDTEVRFTAVQGCLTLGTVYAFVEDANSVKSNGVAVTFSVTALPVITVVGDGTFINGTPNVSIDGLNFGNAQNNQTRVTLNTAFNGSGAETAQSIRSWSDTRVVIDINRGSLPEGDLYVIVRNDVGQTSDGFVVTVTDQGTSEEEPLITLVTPSQLYDTLSGVVLQGSNFGSNRGQGIVELNSSINGTGVSSLQGVTSWGDSSITINVVRGLVPLGTAYLFVRNDSGLRSIGYGITLVDISNTPVIDSIEDGIFFDGETGIIMIGSEFGDAQGTGQVQLYESASEQSTATALAINSWSDTQIDFDMSFGTIGAGSRYIRVKNDDERFSSFFAVTLFAATADTTVSTIDSGYTDTAGWSDLVGGGTGSINFGNTEGVDWVISTGQFVTNIDATRPSVSDGELLIVFAAADSGILPGLTISGSGWNKLTDGQGFGNWTTVWWKTVTNASSEPATYNISKDTDQEDFNVCIVKLNAQQVSDYNINGQSDTFSTTVCNSITPTVDNSLVFFCSVLGYNADPLDSGYPPGVTGCFYRNSKGGLATNQTVGLGLGFIQQTTAQATGSQTWSNGIAKPTYGWSVVVDPPPSGGASNAFDGAARWTPGDGNGDQAQFNFLDVVAAQEIRVYEWHPTPTTSWATNTAVAVGGIIGDSFTIDQSVNPGQWNLVYTTPSATIAGTLVITVTDNANDNVVANAFRIEVDTAGGTGQDTISETMILVDTPGEDAQGGTHAGGVTDAVVSLDATSFREVFESLDTSTLGLTTPGDFRVPITKSFGKITDVIVTFVGGGGIYSFSVEDKDVTLGPRVTLYRFNGTSYVASDAVIDVIVTGVGG